MRNFNSVLLLVGLLIWSSQSAYTLAVVGPFSPSAFKCLALNVPGSVYNVIIRAYQNSQSPAGIDPNAFSTLVNAFTAGFSADLYVEICRGGNATSQINLVEGELVSSQGDPYAVFNGMFYIKVQPSINLQCSWESYSHSDNCNYLKEAVGAVRNLGSLWNPNIITTAHIWQQFFGNSCDTFATDTSS